MLYLEIRGRRVNLPAGDTVQIEHKAPLLVDTLEDSYAPELTIPTEGNEEALGHVHELELQERTTEIEGATLGHQGVPLHRGTLETLNSTSKEVRATFSLEGFVRKLQGIKLPDTMQGIVLPYTAGTEPPNYAGGGSYQLPMHRNTKLYPKEARPTWTNDASEWSSTTAYAVNDYVSYTEHGTVLRTDVWQCIEATSAGQSPETHDTKWRRCAFSIVNAWDKVAEDHYVNEADADFYALVPWFYIKWVVEKALAFIGYTPIGEWMDDARLHEWTIANTTTLDAKRLETDLSFFRAAQDGVQAFNGNWWEFAVPGHDETTSPYQDPDGVWNNNAHKWTCPNAGTFIIKARTTFNRRGTATHFQYQNQQERVVAMLLDQNNVVRAQQYLPMPNTVVPENMTCNVTFTFTCGAGDVGDPFHVVITQRESYEVLIVGAGWFPQHFTMWPQSGSDQYLNSEVTGWQADAAPAVMVPDTEVHPGRHMPEVEVAGFVQAVADAWNLELVPNDTDKTLRMDYREGVAANPERHTTDHSARQVNAVELAHGRATTGMRLKWDVETNEEATEAVENAAECYSEQDLATPLTTGQYTVMKSTRELYKSVFRGGFFSHAPAGYHVPSKLVGEETEAVEKVPALVPLHMVHEKLDGEDYLIPVLEAEGTSDWFHCQGDRSTVWICEFKRMQSASGDVENVPGARSWGYGWDAADRSGSTALWDNSDPNMEGMWQRYWRKWLLLLVNAEPVTMDLLLDIPFLLSLAWHRILHIHSQRYLVQTLPVEYGRDEPLISEGAYLLRIRDTSTPGTPALAGPLSGAGTLGWYSYATTHYFEATSTTNYLAVRSPDGVLHIYNGTGVFAITATVGGGSAGGGWWIAYGSDADGNPTGIITHWRTTGAALIMLPTDENMVWIEFTDGTIANVDLPVLPNLTNLNLENNALQNTDAIINAIDPTIPNIIVTLDGGTSVPRTSDSDTVYNALIALGGTIDTNP